MRKKLATILAVSLWVGSSFNIFANDIDTTQIIPNVWAEETSIHKQKEAILYLNNKLAVVDGQEYELEMVPKVIEGSTYLPLRFMADKLLEAGVGWDPATKQVTIIKDATKVEVTIGSKEAYRNGDQVQLANSAIIDKSTTYLPLRTMAELFEIQIDYDQATKRITLIKAGDTSVPVVKKPAVPQFTFEQEQYTAGQVVRAIDTSFHEEGDPITNRLWMINLNEKQTNSKLENMFSKPNAGTYSVSLKVEAGKGNWSEWVTRQIVIDPNQKPVITRLETLKETYAGGELIEFAHEFENESWESIKAERWTYRQSWEPVNKAVADKPQYIFDEGRYVVTLQLQDDYGHWSNVKEVEVYINKESQRSELEYRFTAGKAGDIIDNFGNFNYQQYKEITPNETILEGGALFLSNSPENVKQNGILYRDTVKGKGRLLFHHHNSFTEEENQLESKKIVLVAENPTSGPVSFTISNKVLKGPSTDILFVGQQLLYDYLKGAGSNQYTLQPGEKMYVYDSGSKKWDRGQLISGQMDFDTNGQVQFTVASVGKDTKMDEIAQLPNLQKDAHPRGTFGESDIHYKIALADTEPVKLILGAGQDEWIEGYDAMLGEFTKNKGNFAVNYRIEVTATEDVGVLLNPRAGLFRGALKWDNEEPFLAPSKGYFIGHNTKAVMLGVIKAGETRILEYSLPNGSASPVLLVFMPKDQW